ncbi:MAG TPA: lytic transglycosylase domain-containing protein [Thermoanaerobaculia bacterium]|nr:lytic transglycosylase domain-containing protein [Thermoanaerobaculia bacterium]
MPDRERRPRDRSDRRDARRLVLDRPTVVGLAAGLVMLQLLIFSAGFLLGAAEGVQALTPPDPPLPLRPNTFAPGEGGVRLASFAVSPVEPARAPASRPAPIPKAAAAPKKASRPSPLAKGSFLVPPPTVTAKRRTLPVRTTPRLHRSAEAYAAMIREAAERHSVSPALVEAVARVESGFNPRALSHKGARGLMQVIPATGRRFGVRSDKLFDPEHNLAAGTAYLAWLSKRYRGNLDFVLAAYNAGEGAVDDHGGIPPYRETRDYVQRVKASLRSIEERVGTVTDDSMTAGMVTAGQ